MFLLTCIKETFSLELDTPPHKNSIRRIEFLKINTTFTYLYTTTRYGVSSCYINGGLYRITRHGVLSYYTKDTVYTRTRYGVSSSCINSIFYTATRYAVSSCCIKPSFSKSIHRTRVVVWLLQFFQELDTSYRVFV